jgi:tight adherence protein B
LKVAEYFALFFITVFFGALIFGFLGGWHPVSFLIGAVLGAFAPRFYVKRQQRQRLNRFNDQLGDMLNLMVNGLRAGYSTMQAMEAISRELPSPISDEFRRVVQEMQLGVPMEAALDNLLRRIPSDDLDFVVTAINVQREVGGNLSEILDSISFTIRERVRIKGEIRVMTAQVRASGTLLSIIPMALALILWFMNPEYLLSFFDGPSPLCGWGAIGLIVIMIVSGYFIMMKIADIEV